MRRMVTPGRADTRAMKKHLVTMVVAVVVLHTVMISLFYALHMGDRAAKTQQLYVAIWVVLTLFIVTTIMKRIRRVRRGR
jgi:hypothetical protein